MDNPATQTSDDQSVAPAPPLESEPPIESAPRAPAALNDTAQSRPYNLEAEQGLLGALLIQNDVMDDVADFLEGPHFFDPLHQRIYTHIARMISNGNLASVVTLKSAMAQDDGLREQGGDQYLASLYSSATTLSNAKQYGQLVYDLALRRALMTLGEDIVAKAAVTELDLPPREQIERAEHQLYELATTGGRAAGFMEFHESLTSAVDMVGQAIASDSHLTGLSCGFKDLDRVLGGLQNSDLIVIASRPGMGKTSLASNIAFHAARNYALASGKEKSPEPGAVVGFFSLEMSAEQLATRLLGEQVGISSSKIRTGDLEHDDYERLMKCAENLHELPLYIDHTGAIPLPTLAARARRLKRQKNLGLLVVDYLQLVRAEERRRDGRVQEISEITQGLKALAKDLQIPVVALSQLSRQVESRDDKRPQLSDLRESGAIEQDADVVIFIYREEYYLVYSEPTEHGSPDYIKWQERMNECRGKAELLIGKNRHGPTPRINLAFNAKLTRFADLDTRHEPEQYIAQPTPAPSPTSVPAAAPAAEGGVTDNGGLTDNDAPADDNEDYD